MTSTTTPGGKTTTSIYDKLGRQVGRIDAAGLREDLTLTEAGQLHRRKIIDATNPDAVWSWEDSFYDAQGRIVEHTVHRFPVSPQPDLGQDLQLTSHTSYYDTPGDPRLGLVHTLADPLGRVTEFDYDDAGRETTRTLPDGTEVTTTYYPDGKVETRTVAYAGPEGVWSLTTSTTYDDQGRVKTVTAPGGQITTTFYDDLGRKKSQLTADSIPGDTGEEHIDRLTSWDYGDLGRIVTTNRPDGAQITREYDERGNLVAYLDTDDNRTEYLYDDHGRLETITYPDASTKTFTYLADGEVDTITRADGSVVDFVYEADTGRLETITVTGGVQPGGATTFGYDLAGHLIDTSNTDTALGFTWDSLGNQLSESIALPGVAPALGTKALTRTFDHGNRPETLVFPDGLSALTRGYDTGDRLQSLTLGGTSLWQATHAGSRMTKIERGNSLATTFAYDAQGRPTNILTGIPDAGDEVANPIHALGLGWTEASLRRSKSREDLNRTIETFHYDGVGHLESNEANRIPAIAEANQDLTTLSGLNPRTLEEWWTVNTVDELEKRNRKLEGRQETASPQHNDLHQVTEKAGKVYTWDVNGNLESQGTMQADDSVVTDATYTHDWRDRLVQVDQGDTTTRLVVDPLGRLVTKVTQTAAGDAARVYLHDGDQVVAEYVQETGGTGYQLDRRKTWGRWIDDLVVEEVDTDHDGILDKMLFPVGDMLGSVQLLTDEQGEIVERVEYDSDGTPHFFAPDVRAPTVTRVASTGGGVRPNGDVVSADVIELSFSEVLDTTSVFAATLTPDGGSATSLTVTLDAGARSAVIADADLVDGQSYTLHVSGAEDRWGNALVAADVTFSVADTAVYSVLSDTTAPTVLAVLDASDSLLVVFDEPVMDGNLSVTRSGFDVEGTTTRVGPQMVKWESTDGWPFGATFTVDAHGVTDLSGNGVASSNVTFTHLALQDEQVLTAYSQPDESIPLAASAYGATSLFQGRGWHGDLGLMYYRARWYSPSAVMFLERDPVGYFDGSSLYQFVSFNGVNYFDPFGLLKGNLVPGQDVMTADKIRVEVDGEILTVSPQSGVVVDEKGRRLDIDDPRAEAARDATGLGFSNQGLDNLIGSLASQTALLQNRWTAGFAIEAVNTLMPGVTPKGGTLMGVNIQFWLNRRNQPVAAVYGIESFSTQYGDKGEKVNPARRPITNVEGIVFGGGVSADVAWYEHPAKEYAPFNAMNDRQLVESWTGGFREYGFSTKWPLVGGSGFHSIGIQGGEGRYEGVSWALRGKGAGFFKADTTFHLIDGPYNPASVLGFFQGQVALRDLKIPAPTRNAIVNFCSMMETARRLYSK